jgi:DNA-binding transcriptional LysR family regulator
MVGFHIATIERVTCASPSYIDKYGIPKHPEDLRKHNCLLYRRDGRLFTNWEYSHTAGNHKVRVASNRISNDTDIIRRWAIAGRGITNRSQLDLSCDIIDGKLIQLLADFRSPPVELYLICPSRKQVTPAVIAFREMLREKCARTISSISLKSEKI